MVHIFNCKKNVISQVLGDLVTVDAPSLSNSNALSTLHYKPFLGNLAGTNICTTQTGWLYRYLPSFIDLIPFHQYNTIGEGDYDTMLSLNNNAKVMPYTNIIPVLVPHVYRQVQNAYFFFFLKSLKVKLPQQVTSEKKSHLISYVLNCLNNNFFEHGTSTIYNLKKEDLKQNSCDMLAYIFTNPFDDNFLNWQPVPNHSVKSLFGLNSLLLPLQCDSLNKLTLEDLFLNPLFGISIGEYINLKDQLSQIFNSSRPSLLNTSHKEFFVFSKFINLDWSSSTKRNRSCLNSLNASQESIVSIHKLSMALMLTYLYYTIFIENVKPIKEKSSLEDKFTKSKFTKSC